MLSNGKGRQPVFPLGYKMAKVKKNGAAGTRLKNAQLSLKGAGLPVACPGSRRCTLQIELRKLSGSQFCPSDTKVGPAKGAEAP